MGNTNDLDQSEKKEEVEPEALDGVEPEGGSDSAAADDTENIGKTAEGPSSPLDEKAGTNSNSAPKKPLDRKAKIAIAAVVAAIAIFGIAYVATNGFHQHTWVDATCTLPKTCSDCGATEGDALGHDYIGTKKDATCTKGAYTHYECSRCGDAYDEETGEAALGHEAGDWTYDESSKQEVCKCTRCGAVVEKRDVTKETLATLLAGWKATLDECYKRDSGSNYKALYRDQVMVTITNRSDKAIRSAEVEVCAWDASGNPVSIGYWSSSKDIYGLNCSDINIQPGESWSCSAHNVGFDLDSTLTLNIAKVEGVIESVTYLDGTTESNPYESAWISLYESKTN